VVLELVDVVDVVVVVVVVGIGTAIRTQTLFLETNRQTTGTFTFLTWAVDFLPRF
jgi:hypothetical protein